MGVKKIKSSAYILIHSLLNFVHMVYIRGAFFFFKYIPRLFVLIWLWLEFPSW